jgi:hypothetical protein
VPHLMAVRELFVDALTPDQLEAAHEIATALRTRLGELHATRSRRTISRA